MLGHVIKREDEGLPGYYSPREGRNLGTPHGWTPDADKALHFLRAKDAQDFLEMFLPHAMPFSQVVSHEPAA